MFCSLLLDVGSLVSLLPVCRQLHQSEAARESEMTDLNVLTVEFTNRIGEAEKRLQAAGREKDQLKKKLQRAEAELANKCG